MKNSNDSELIEQKRKLLAALLAKHKESNKSESILNNRKADRTQKLSLSFAQQRLWLLDKIDGGSSHYNMPGALRLTGDLNIGALTRALTTIIERHESLRTYFVEGDDGQPAQVIRPPSGIEVSLTDMSLLPEAERESDLAGLVAAEAGKPFDLSTDLMLRAQLVKVAAQSHVLLVTMHHIASDGWSMGLLINEFSALYAAYVRGADNPLPELEVQYADYAQWQRDWLQGEVLDKQLGYWERQLAGLPAVHSLPLDNPRPKVQTFNGAYHYSAVDAKVSDKLNALCQDIGGTLFMGLHAAFSVLLSRYSNETDIAVGSPIANREQAEVEHLIGFFVNTLVLRSDLSGKPSFAALLKQSKQMLQDAYAHQQVPFEQLVEKLQPERSLSYSPLFQVMLVLQNNEQGTLELPGLSLSPVEHSVTIAKYDLTLNVTESKNGLHIGWGYNTDLFDMASIERLANHFELLLTGLVNAPQENVFAIEMLPAEEVRQQLTEWNGTVTDFPAGKCIHQLFEAQVKENPGAIALVLEETQLTYGELNARANQLAQYLIRERGVTPDTLVGLCTERSPEMIVAIMGILKAGGAYVPLDPGYPSARLAYMLDDANLHTVLTQTSLQGQTPVTDSQAVYLDSGEMLAQLQTYATDNVALDTLTSNHLAYVIYTSGSTGEPKGVMVEHKALVNNIVDNATRFGVDGNSVFLQSISINFDAGSWVIWMSLSKGASLTITPSLFLDTGSEKAFPYKDVSHLMMTPSSLALLEPGDFEGIKSIIVGGEPCSQALAGTWQGVGSFFNAYGPTEAAICSTVSEIFPDKPVTLGEPINNVTCHVLNNARCVPVGVAGELHIGGAGLARGYLNQPELTREKFIPNPFFDKNDPNSSERLYKTGDLVRYLPDGKLEFLGRIDHQVKIRGLRIELGEIEHQLLIHDQVNDAVVEALAGDGAGKYLVAYVTHDNAAAMLAEDKHDATQTLRHDFIEALKAALNQELPDYMVPPAFVVLEQLPLTANGKVDRKALPAPDMSWQQKSYVAPTTETEKRLCEIWQQVLGLERVGITDNFFELGGHSLLVTQVMVKIRKQFSVELPIKALFEQTTIAQLALSVTTDKASLVPGILPVNRAEIDHIPLSFAQERLWFIDQLGAGGGYTIPGAVIISGEFDLSLYEKACNLLIARHEIFRTIFTSKAGQARQVILDSLAFKLAFIDLSHHQDTEACYQEARQLCESEAAKPFELSAGPLLRGMVIKLPQQEHILMFNMHHIISDGLSMKILINEFDTVLQCLGKDEPVNLPALPIQYADYSIWQRTWLEQEGIIEEQIAYWKKTLANAPESIALASDYPRGTSASFDGDKVSFKLDAQLTKRLHQLARQQNCTLYVVLLAAFKVLLYRYTDQEDLCVGSPIANRKFEELDNLIGMFANTVVYRSQITATMSFVDYLQQMKTVTTEVYANQDVPFEKIVDLVGVERKINQNPLIQHIFVLQQFLQSGAEEQLPFNDNVRNFDFNLNDSVFDQIIAVVERQDGITGTWSYDTQLFKQSRIEAFISSYVNILNDIVQEPNQRIGRIRLADDTRLQLIEDTWAGQTGQAQASLQTLLQETFTRCKDKCAIQAGGKALNYFEVAEQVRLVAHNIQKSGLTPGERVGVLLPDSKEKALVYLGLIMAGISIVPVPLAETHINIAKIVRHSAIKHFIGAQEEDNLKINNIKLADLLSGNGGNILPEIAAGKPYDEVLVELVWLPSAELCELSYTQADVLGWLNIEPALLDKQNNADQYMLCHLLQGLSYEVNHYLPGDFNLEAERVYHLSDLEMDGQNRFHTRLSSIAKSREGHKELELLPAHMKSSPLLYPEDSARTVTQVMLHAGKETSLGVSVFNDEGEESFLSYCELLALAMSVTQGLQDQEIKPRSAVILQCENLLDHFVAFWGCILGGYIPVTVAIPNEYVRGNAVVEKLVDTWELLDNPVVISNLTNNKALVELSWPGAHAGLRVLAVEALKDNEQSKSVYNAQPDEVAFYQLSSGSTGKAKCIEITHKGVVAHCEAARQLNHYQPEDRWLNWLPLDHVGSILMWHLQSAYLSSAYVQLSTNFVLSNPIEWIRQLSLQQINHTWSPNFGYQLILDTFSKRDGNDHFDLSAIRTFLNAGEQVQEKTIKSFVELLKPYQLDARSMQPAFGMAETCTAITYCKHYDPTAAGKYFKQDGLSNTLTLAEDENSGGLAFASTGSLLSGTEIRIVNRNNQVLNELEIGQLQIKGTVITSGYYKYKEEEKNDVFSEDGWFISGDLGFIYQGQLYITGREKEVIIVRGANIYCYELEAVVNEIDAVESGYVGTFPVTDQVAGTEGFGIAYAGENTPEVIEEISARVIKNFGMSPSVIIPMSQEEFPRTTSGKIQRSIIAKNLIEGCYDKQYQSPNRESEKSRTIPDWFYRGIWQKSEAKAVKQQLAKIHLIMLSEESLALSTHAYASYTNIQPQFLDEALAAMTDGRGWNPQEKLVIACYDRGDVSDFTCKLKNLKTMMSRRYRDIPCTWVGLYQDVDRCIINGERALLRSFTRERPGSETVVLDLDRNAVCPEILESELSSGFYQASDIRYREGQRSAYQLERLAFKTNGQALLSKAYKPGINLVFGGLGGIGSVICELLLQRGNQQIIIVGSGPVTDRQARYHELAGIAETTGSKITYIQHNILDNKHDDLCRQLAAIEQSTGSKVKTLVQATGSNFGDRAIDTNTAQDYLETIRENEQITQILQTISRKRAGLHLIEIGSVNGSFGGFNASVYAYRKGYELGRYELFRQSGISYTNIQQTMWENIGIGKGRKNHGLNNGYRQIHQYQGLKSLEMILNLQQPGLYYMGVDGKKREVNQHLTTASKRSIASPELLIPGIENRLALYLQGRGQLTNPMAASDLLGHRQVSLRSNSGRVVSPYQPGSLCIQVGEQSVNTGVICNYGTRFEIALHAGSDHYRGYQLNFSDIKSVIMRHPDVSDCYLVHKWDQYNSEQLIAYLVPENKEASLDFQALKSYLASKLPYYLLPSKFVTLDALPLTPNGKVDRKALPAPDMTELQATYVAPESETEKILCSIWQEVLGLDQVGVTDNFFSLGGHSLLATRMVAQIKQHFAVDLPLKSLFEAPTIREGALVVDTLVPAPVRPAIRLVSREQDLLLSFAQQRLWLLDRIDGSNSHYNMPEAIRLTGDLNIEALTGALSTIVERHESLRTCFVEGGDGQPLQLIRPSSGIEVPVTDISLLPAAERESDLAELVSAEAGKPFDLGADLMLRAQLVKVAEQSHVLLVTMHHIASDGWSMGILINEFSALYGAYVRGEENPFPPLELQYADYAQWQRNWLQGQVLDEQIGYWQKQLAGLPVVHSLPLDNPRPKVQTSNGAYHYSVIDAKVSEQLKGLCQEIGGTLFMGLHAAFSVLLARYSNETDIVVGSPIANREQAEVANLIGFFVNTLVLRSDLSGKPSFAALLERSKQMLLDAYAHQQVPFEQLVDTLQPERSLSHSALFQVMLVLQNNEEGTLELPGLTLSPVKRSADIARYDLTLNVTETDNGLHLGWEYNTDLFNPGTIERLAKHFELLLAGLVNAPQESVFAIDMLPAEEAHQQLVQWNETAADYPKDKCIHELFEQHAQESPEAVAVVFEGAQLTYGELNARANRLAHYLIREREVTPDTLVGICIERSLDMVVAIMAVLKAGGAYVPLDPDYPAARLAYMLEDADLTTVLTQEKLKGETPVSESQALYIDNQQVLGRLACYPADNVRVEALSSSHLAYVIYTSGSTGNPKGVMVEHSGLINFVCFDILLFALNNNSQFLHTLSLGFDAGNGYLFDVLSSGGIVHLIGFYDEVCRYAHENDISHLACPLARLNNLAFYPMDNLRCLITGGDEIKSAFLEKLNADIDVFNVYGPTETTITATCTKIALNRLSSIGKPIANVQCYVMANDAVIMPTGVAGELYIGGSGLARGYLNNPELTDEKFVPNPYYDKTKANSSERLYKTGDLVRWLPDGNLEFLGRIDHQVKIRGFRIELGEIEHQLLTHDEVNDAVVVARESGGGDKRLVAYVTHDNAAAMLAGDKGDEAQALRHKFIDSLKASLGEDLPDYMVPSVFVVLESLPLTSNGKVDNKSLPAPDMSLQQRAYVAPGTETEKLLCGIWQEVLGLEQVGITDNFFELGGHSLLAVKLVANINKTIELNLDVKNIFVMHDVASLAAYIDVISPRETTSLIDEDREEFEL
ncbi:non-ribosomal peptide synthetase [Thalassomonas viridans]|uniref:Non-ribosomal peptide synthetase n=1 Tax=Thalassomonas viridans TaxID=137584 RepID=A0AAF0CE56_9GAMM|nr:non-ribosomal peptide synthetase [Thalassomonas viridans]WDE09226.1 non-ribosomal peptide synthetase [Thalassomonas viridans]